MPLDTTIRRIITKELTLFFSSPVAYLFLASFAAIEQHGNKHTLEIS
jgi:hypothetical protein